MEPRIIPSHETIDTQALVDGYNRTAEPLGVRARGALLLGQNADRPTGLVVVFSIEKSGQITPLTMELDIALVRILERGETFN